MNNKRLRFAFLNMLFNFAYQVINTLVNIVIPPLIISKFGSSINGLISTIKQMLSYVQLIGSGISESTVVSLYKPLTVNDEDRISSIFNACSKVFFNAGLIFSATSASVAFIYPFFISKQLNYFFIVALVMALSIAGMSEFFVVGKCRSLIMADQRYYVVSIAQILGALGNLLVTVLLIRLNLNIVIIQLGSSIIYAARMLVLHTYVKKHYSFIDKNIAPDFDSINKRKSATIHQLAGLISFGSQTVVVSFFCGLAEASIYSVYNLVFTGINTVLSTISSALLSTFGDIIAKDEKGVLSTTYSIYETLYYICLFSLYTTTYLMFLPFIKLYTSNISDANYYRSEYAVLFCIMGVINCLRTPGATLINASGHYRETQNRAIIEMIICFVGELVLVNLIGPSGVLLATIIAYLYRSIDVVIYSNKHILNSRYILSFSRIILNASLYLVVLIIGAHLLIPVNSYFDWIITATIITIVSFVVFIGANSLLARKEYKLILDKICRK